MKSLQESLFDPNITKKEVSINYETLRDMLFDFGKERQKLLDKANILYHEGKQVIYFITYINDSKEEDSVCFELQLGVSNLYNKENKLMPVLTPPRLIVYGGSFRKDKSPTGHQWLSSASDINVSERLLNKKLNLKKTYPPLIVAQDNIGKIFKLYDKMVNYFCSDEYKEILQKYVKDWESKHNIPGLILDILIKKLINR